VRQKADILFDGYVRSSGVQTAAGPDFDNGILPDRTQVAVIKGANTLSQQIYGLTPGQNYWLQFRYNASYSDSQSGANGINLKVKLGGNLLATITNIGPAGFSVGHVPFYFTNLVFVPTNASELLEFDTTPTTASTTPALLLDAVSMVQRDTNEVVIENPDFVASGEAPYPTYISGLDETPGLVDGWQITGSFGCNSSAGPFLDNGVAPEQGEVLFLQDSDTASISISGLVAGQVYTLSYSVNRRAYISSGTMTYDVAFGHIPLLTGQLVAAAGGSKPFLTEYLIFTNDAPNNVLGFASHPVGDTTLLLAAIHLAPGRRIPPQLASQSPAPGERSLSQPPLQFVLAQGSYPLSTTNFELLLNGTNVAPSATVTPINNGIIISYAYPTLPPGTNTVELIASDKNTPPMTVTTSFTFVIRPAPSLILSLGDTNRPTLLPQEILSAYNAGYSNVKINPGTYVMANGASTAITLQTLNNFTINGSNVLITVGPGHCFDILNCTNVSIEGATVRSQIYPFTQGRVTSIGTNNGTLYCDWQISAGYPTTNFQWWFDAVSASNRTINLQQGDIFWGTDFPTNTSSVPSNAVYLGDRTWQLSFPGWSGFSFQTNDWLVARWSNQWPAYWLGYCSNCTLLNCTSQCGGIVTFWEGYSISDHILGCQIEPAPVPPPGGTELPVVASEGDGIHVWSDVGGPDIEYFTATNVMLDDCIAIHGSYQTVTAVSGYNVTLSLYNVFPAGGSGSLAGFAVGQPVRISDTNGFFAQANCTAIQNLQDYQVITLDEEIAIPIGALASNPDANGSGYKIINCQLGNTRWRAIIAEADNGLITGCTISGAGHGMWLGPEYYWGSGDYVWNVTVSNNTVRNCGPSGISVVSNGSIGNQNITVQNNIVESPVFSDGLSVSGCNGLTVSGNTFISPDLGYYPIYLYDSTNVTLLENLVMNAPANAGLIEADATVAGIINQRNGIFLAGAYSFVNRLSNLVLDDPPDGGAGARATQQASVGGDNSWILSPLGNGYCALLCAGNGLALGVDGSTASNAPLVMETHTGSRSQLWALAPVTGLYVALTNALSGMAAQAQSSVAGQGLVQAPFSGSANQQWLLAVLNVPIYTWDPQGTSGANPYTGSMSGTWENAEWSSSPSGQASPAGWAEGNNALFAVNTGTGTPAFTVTMNKGHTVAGIYNGSETTGPCMVTIAGKGTMANNERGRGN